MRPADRFGERVLGGTGVSLLATFSSVLLGRSGGLDQGVRWLGAFPGLIRYATSWAVPRMIMIDYTLWKHTAYELDSLFLRINRCSCLYSFKKSHCTFLRSFLCPLNLSFSI